MVPRTPENGTYGLKVTRRPRTGIVQVGDQSVADEPQPSFGGFAASGYGHVATTARR
ncbi:hypothetical protein [Streptomyces sp. B21-108]|uniref:hypothetical protein n=1 Tax=Streptomyces sp. B21-108 TaxID=3039419 RepID=UPI002FF0876B